ncbi:Phosphoribosylamine--glycine ligase [Minicystis rosea]|nr:Phosphoribosylamine--glycine ligase [Minicystis rosea]
MTTRTRVRLTGVPETMLWTLHDRAREARRPDTILRDPDAVRIQDAIDYDFRRDFGAPHGTHAVRARVFDDVVKPWIAAHPEGTVVELACGLETQCLRCDDGRVRWVGIDVPEVIDVREQLIPSTERRRHLRQSALDLSWMDAIDPAKGLLVTAQGLFMYLDEAEVRRLFVAIVERFPGVEMIFDTIARWFSKKTLAGFRSPSGTTVPPMPWGIDRREIEPTLRSWSARVEGVDQIAKNHFRGLPGVIFPLLARVRWLENIPPSVVHVRTARR